MDRGWRGGGIGLSLLLAACAAETGPPPDVSGRWTGQCVNCPVRAFGLELRQSGDQLSGTLQPSGRSGLGERPMPLLNGRITGRSVSFRVVGADGIPMEAELRVSGDGRSLEGQGRHRAGFGLSFTRTGN